MRDDMGTKDGKRAMDRAMARYAGGEDAAFGELYELAAPRLHAFLARRTRGDAARAEDLLQQTFLKVHVARSRFVAGSPFMPWAFAIARRLLIDGHRLSHRELALDPQVEEPVPPSTRRGPAPDASCESKELVAICARAFRSLPAPQRDAFELIRWDGLSTAEAASTLGTTANAVKLRVHRTMKVLREATRSACAVHSRESLRDVRTPSASTRLDKVVRAMPSSRAA